MEGGESWGGGESRRGRESEREEVGAKEKKRWPCDAENGGGVFVPWMNVCASLCVWVSKIMTKN